MELQGAVRPDQPLLVVALDLEAAQLGDRLPVLLTGVGKVRAAIAVTRLLATARPSMVVNIGTAGGLRHGLDGVHEIGTVLQHDFASEAIEKITGIRFGPPIELGAGLTLATGDQFVQGGPVRDALAERADLVDMEAYAVAAACREADVPVRIVKLVSDDADEHALRSWVDTVSDHARTLATWVDEHL
ncbi:nucleosidase [Longivirga aurantiaca]|uniref:Nucleosidase n=1 Tax=Longivirga aurantiaca TaxID=1837743 RepID=A0ABW1T6E4_9ACTN